MSKNLIIVLYSVLGALGIAGGTVILVLKPDAFAAFTGWIGTVLGLALVAATQIYGFGKVANNQSDLANQVNTIEENTNGKLTRMLDENTRLTNVLIQRGIDPVTGEATIDSIGKHAND